MEDQTKACFFALNISKNAENVSNLARDYSNIPVEIATKKEIINKFEPPLRISSTLFGTFVTINKNNNIVTPNKISHTLVILFDNILSLVILNVLTIE
ncbi:hypothetical protein IET11_002570 [Enterococcus faecium]|nr:hypothetical protein [Enterococcus faecium]EGP4917874.1 hypothetical protein [Enterococcus faecium]EMF0453326.1 hypothetical protein [Enterococcus faecium]